MPEQKPQPTPQQRIQAEKRKSLAAICGASVAAILCVIVPKFEGTKQVGYLDPIGIPTKCMGDTTNVVVGKRYTVEECKESLETQLIAHAEPVLKCNPELAGRTYQLASAVSFAYNIGTGAYCKSQVSIRFRRGDWSQACKAMNESDDGHPQWVTAGGRVLSGLVTRRAGERALCETELPK